MTVLTIASMEGEPRAVFSALEHHWAHHTPAEGLVERTVAHGPRGFLVIETWETEAAASAAWSLVRLEGVPAPDVQAYAVLARTGPPGPAKPAWSELALPEDSAWDERVVPRDS